MWCRRKRISGFVMAAFLLCTIYTTPNVISNDPPEWELTIEIEFDKDTLNLSQNTSSIIFFGWVIWNGYAALPLTVHLTAHSDIGDVFLSQYDFTFQTPDSIPFDGIITHQLESQPVATPQLTIGGTVEQGGLNYNLPPTSYLVPIYSYKEEEISPKEAKEPENSHNYFILLGLPSLLFLFLVYFWVVRGKLRRAKGAKAPK
jgi:hypothetical protein